MAFVSGCSECSKIIDGMSAPKQPQAELGQLDSMLNATKSGQPTTGKPLPEELPLIIRDEVSLGGLRDSMHQYASDMPDIDKDAAADITKWATLGFEKVSTIIK